MSVRQRARPASRPCPKLTWWQVVVIRASWRLTAVQKLVLWLMYELDRGDGAFMGPAEAAQQIGVSLSHFKETRVDLQRLGLLVRVEVRGSQLDFWFPRVPADFETEPPRGATQPERRRWVREWADTLDGRIKDGISDLSRTEFPTYPPQNRTEFPKAQDGNSVPSEHVQPAKSGLSDTLKAVSQRVTTAVITDANASRESESRTAVSQERKPRGNIGPDVLELMEKLERKKAGLRAAS